MTVSRTAAAAIGLALSISLPVLSGERIVTLGPCATEHLCLLGMEDSIVGVTMHDRPERRQGRQIVGSLLEPNIEAIAALKPDAVVASKEGNRPEVAAKLRALGIDIVVMEEFFSFSDICDALVSLGKRFGREAIASEIVAAQTRRLATVRGRSRSARRPSVFLCLGWRPLVTVGGKTYLDELLRYAGGRNIFSDLNKKYAPVSVEEVVRRKPEAVVILAMDAGDESAIRKELGVVPAVRAGRVLTVDPFPFGSPTPSSFVDGVEQVARFLSPPAGSR